MLANQIAKKKSFEFFFAFFHPYKIKYVSRFTIPLQYFLHTLVCTRGIKYNPESHTLVVCYGLNRPRFPSSLLIIYIVKLIFIFAFFLLYIIVLFIYLLLYRSSNYTRLNYQRQFTHMELKQMRKKDWFSLGNLI